MSSSSWPLRRSDLRWIKPAGETTLQTSKLRPHRPAAVPRQLGRRSDQQKVQLQQVLSRNFDQAIDFNPTAFKDQRFWAEAESQAFGHRPDLAQAGLFDEQINVLGG